MQGSRLIALKNSKICNYINLINLKIYNKNEKKHFKNNKKDLFNTKKFCYLTNLYYFYI